MLREFLYALRSLRSSPVFAGTAVVTIALGIGASTAIFSVANAVLLRPLPYKDSERLVVAVSDLKRRGVRDQAFSAADFFDMRNSMQSTLEGLAGVYTFRQAFSNREGSPELVRCALITPNFFRVMGGRILAGRDFEDADAQPPPPPAPGVAPPPPLPFIVILSYSYWQRRFGGDPSIFGHPMPNQAIPVGVVEPGFELLFAPQLNVEPQVEIWVAGRTMYDNSARNSNFIQPVGRLRPGVSLQQAQAAADRVTAELQKNFVIARTAGQQIRLEPMRQHLTAGIRPTLMALAGAVIFLLLISCSNVANLLLVRSGLRERELAVRTALGASWSRLMGQMLAESLVLATGGGLLGLGLAWAGIRELRAIAPASLPRLNDIAINPAVLGFTALAALIAAALFGMVPALRAARPDIAHVLRAGGRTSGLGTTGLLRNAVVVAEVALSFILLVGSGLMFRSFRALERVDPGFDPGGLLTFQVLGGRGGPQPAGRAAFIREIQRHMASIPGVQSVAASSPFPLSGGFTAIRWGLPAAQGDPTKFRAADWQVVLPGYFEAMRIKLIAGRTFTDADNGSERAVAVVDDLFAAKAFPNESAVGKRILARMKTAEAEWVEIVGVVAHQRHNSLAEAGREQIFFTDGFMSHGVVQRWALRTAGNPASYAQAAREAIRQCDKALALVDVQPMTALVDKAQASTRFSLLLIGVFAGVAALLAAVGLYGVLSTVVRQRTAEIGVRMAMGAAPSGIFGLMIGYGLRLSAVGVAAGLAGALALTRIMNSMLVDVKATDPLTFAAAVAVFLAVAGIACWVPARRAAGLAPTEALRRE